MKKSPRQFVVCVFASTLFVSTIAGLSTAKAAKPTSSFAEMITAYVAAQAELNDSGSRSVTAIANAKETNARTLGILGKNRTLSLDNSLKTADIFYQKRQLNENYTELKRSKKFLRENSTPRPSSSPQRLANYQFQQDQGKLHWPYILQEEPFFDFRVQLESLLAKRKLNSVGTTDGTFQKVKKLAEEMHVVLRSKIHEFPPSDYMESRKFIESLVVESRFSKQIKGIAAN